MEKNEILSLSRKIDIIIDSMIEYIERRENPALVRFIWREEIVGGIKRLPGDTSRLLDVISRNLPAIPGAKEGKKLEYWLNIQESIREYRKGFVKIPDDIMFIRNPHYNNQYAKRVLDKGMWGWAVKVEDFPAIKEMYPDVDWEIVDVGWNDVIAYRWVEVDDWVCGESDKRPLPVYFDPNIHPCYIREEFCPGEGFRPYFFTHYACVWKSKPYIKEDE